MALGTDEYNGGWEGVVITDIQRALLEETMYGPEPLHGVLYGLLTHGILSDPREIVTPLLDLMAAGYLEGKYHSLESGWVSLSDAKREDLRKDLLEYIELHEADGFKEYPEPREYEFKATKKGFALVKE